jgi:hypothetical protein
LEVTACSGVVLGEDCDFGLEQAAVLHEEIAADRSHYQENDAERQNYATRSHIQLYVARSSEFRR